MGRKYTVSYQGTITAAGGDTDLLEVLPADDKPCRLLSMTFSQISEVGDAAEEGLRISVLVLPATVTSGTGGSAVTPQVAGDSADAAAGFAAECNNTTIATTTGTISTRREYGWNIRNSPCEIIFAEPDRCPKAKQGEALVVRLQTTVADDLTGVFVFEVEEE